MPQEPLFDPSRWIDLVAAFSGSVLTLFVRRDFGRWEAIGIFTTGQVFAFFGTAYLSNFLPHGDGAKGVTGLLIGSLSFYILGRIVAFVRRGVLPVIGKMGSGNDDV